MAKLIKRVGGTMFLAGCVGFILARLTLLNWQVAATPSRSVLLMVLLCGVFLGIFLFVLGSVFE